jgi:hypothetical protein
MAQEEPPLDEPQLAALLLLLEEVAAQASIPEVQLPEDGSQPPEALPLVSLRQAESRLAEQDAGRAKPTALAAQLLSSA